MVHAESVSRRINVVELIAFSRPIGFDPFKILAIVEAATESDHTSENEEWLSCPTSAALSLGGFRKDQLVYTLVGKTCELMNVVYEYANSLAPRCGKSLSIE
ncbi:hypothetical protein TM1040_3825 (plasmid) [Ruegeria sp. TM1040]|nr:hypothetical protein TM1040_3825 [Ruegeria sp. TM1040]